MRGLIRFAAVMGPLSSMFDLVTFGMLLYVSHLSPEAFRTTWFLKSMVTEILVIFIIRTNGRPWRNLPSPALAVSSSLALVVAMAVPFTPAGRWFGFQTPPPLTLVAVAVVAVAYLVTAEMLKAWAIGGATRRLSVQARPRVRGIVLGS